MHLRSDIDLAKSRNPYGANSQLIRRLVAPPFFHAYFRLSGLGTLCFYHNMGPQRSHQP